MGARQTLARFSWRLVPWCAALAAACADLSTRIPGELLVIDTGAPVLLQGLHVGPPVVAGDAGPKRFLAALDSTFDTARALETTAFVERFYRAPANDGYEAVLAHLEAQLRAHGYGTEDSFTLELLETPLEQRNAASGEREAAQAWTPLSARIALIEPDSPPRVLHEFSTAEGVDRTMLPVHAPACEVEGGVALELLEIDPGEIFVTSAPPERGLIGRARERGAVALVSGNIEPYNVDPSGRQRHLDAVQFRQVEFATQLPVCMVSPRSLLALREAAQRDPRTRVRFEARVRFDSRPLRTLCATIVGTDRANEAVVTVSHVQEPGACDNASGVAGLLESACGIARAVRAGELERPSRSLVFLWGDEFRQTAAWFAATQRKAVAGLSSDMTGESRELTGAIALLERMPDPGALLALAPDAHTAWGQAEVDAQRLVPNGLALIARCALLDVAGIDGEWHTADHPYEGGSDHDEFIARGVPAALFWHFTDFAYHTSLDRMAHVDGAELRRTALALSATALALADPKPADLERYLRSLNEERKLRVAAAEAEHEPELAEAWRQWTDGARRWLRVECLRIPEEELRDQP
ncbi:MAG: M28 family peptidase [Planctomycetes bacterium]|nr:M28 family peptidase [Planctomycetota bacterium]